MFPVAISSRPEPQRQHHKQKRRRASTKRLAPPRLVFDADDETSDFLPAPLRLSAYKEPAPGRRPESGSLKAPSIEWTTHDRLVTPAATAKRNHGRERIGSRFWSRADDEALDRLITTNPGAPELTPAPSMRRLEFFNLGGRMSSNTFRHPRPAPAPPRYQPPADDDCEDLPPRHHFLSTLFTSLLLVAYVLFLGTFTSTRDEVSDTSHAQSNKLHPETSREAILQSVRNLGLLVSATLCTTVGALGVAWLSHVHRGYRAWLLDRLYMPGAGHAIVGLTSTFVGVYATKQGDWSVTARMAAGIQVCCVIMFGVLAGYHRFMLSSTGVCDDDSEVSVRLSAFSMKEIGNSEVGKRRASPTWWGGKRASGLSAVSGFGEGMRFTKAWRISRRGSGDGGDGDDNDVKEIV